MRKKIILLSLSVCLSFGLATGASAHEPKLTEDGGLNLIKNPEVSQAFYGELKGHEAEYLVEFRQAGDLFLQIMVPDLPGTDKDKVLTVKYLSRPGENARPLAIVFLAAADWQKYREEYLGDDYWAGPELKQPAEAGYYLVSVSSPDNQGKYVLTAGEKEELTAVEAVRAAAVWPQLKMNFFNKPAWSIFEGKIGHYFGFGLLGLIVLVFMFYKFNQVYK